VDCLTQNFLRLLAEHTSNELEKNSLLELCSRQGSSQFESTIRIPGLSLLDILLEYPSCAPPPQVLIEHLPRLIPRAYSISSSPFQNKDSFTFAFNVITFTKEEGRKYSRAGVCTGWLYEMVRNMLMTTSDNDTALSDLETLLDSSFSNMSLNERENDKSTKNVVIYRRKNHNFRLPEDINVPIIMVGPGMYA
jgi:methionine synthase reductase